ncbi:MAG: hypothetical protein AB1505_14015 [Candidatus Latescibacterota bacterium]
MATIREIRCIRTRANATWVIVKVVTDQPGLHGIGSASDHYHAAAVVAAVQEGLASRLIGREVSRIEDIWQSASSTMFGCGSPRAAASPPAARSQRCASGSACRRPGRRAGTTIR